MKKYTVNKVGEWREVRKDVWYHDSDEYGLTIEGNWVCVFVVGNADIIRGETKHKLNSYEDALKYAEEFMKQEFKGLGGIKNG